MRRRGNNTEDLFEERCNQVRIKLIYLDEVNDAAHELAKLHHETELHFGQK